MASRIARLFDFLFCECERERPKELGLHVSAVFGIRRCGVIERPQLNLTDRDKCILKLREDAKGPFTWESSDPSQVGLEPQGEGLTCYATTPLDAGEATITVKARGYEDETMKIVYVDSTPGELGLTAGDPEPD